MVFLINSLGFLLYWMPEWFLRLNVYIAGRFIYYFIPEFRHILLSNLHHAFPDRSMEWIRKTAKKSASSTIEMGIMALTINHFSEKKIKKHFKISEEDRINFNALNIANPEERHAVLALVPHCVHMEVFTMTPLLLEGKMFVKIGTMFRPLNNFKIDSYIKKSRERWGVELLSRNSSMKRGFELLKEKNVFVLLFDQSAGRVGTAAYFFNQICSTTEIPGLFSERTNPHVVFFYTRRTGFLRAEVKMHSYEGDKSHSGLTLGMNRWLENKLRDDEIFCQDWLWLHRRWKLFRRQDDIFRIKLRGSLVNEYCAVNHLACPPKNFRLWIRLPNWLGDVVMALPIVQTLRQFRPDVEITLLAQPAFRPFLESIHIAEKIIDLPQKEKGYYGFFSKLKTEFPDIQINFTNSLRSDLEAWLIGAPIRLGMRRPWKMRPLLCKAWKMPRGLDETKRHQTRVWQRWMKSHGLQLDLNLTPLKWKDSDKKSRFGSNSKAIIGMICGTENMPEKRWPISHWKKLIELILNANADSEIHLFGTKRDRDITSKVAEGFGEKVKNRAGETNLTEYCDALTDCAVVICNDTGGMHLANALGVSIIAIFGPTNPVRTGPIFDAPKTILQPDGCPKTGGMPIALVFPETVYEAFSKHNAS